MVTKKIKRTAGIIIAFLDFVLFTMCFCMEKILNDLGIYIDSGE